MSVANNGKQPGGITGKGFMSGKSGNPYGRPKARGFLRWAINHFLSRPHPDEKDKTRLQVLIARLEKEDPRALLGYGFGKPDKPDTESRPATVNPTHSSAGQPVEFKAPADNQGTVYQREGMWRGSTRERRRRDNDNRNRADDFCPRGSW